MTRHLPQLHPYTGRIDPVDGKYYVGKVVRMLVAGTSFYATIDLMWTPEWARVSNPPALQAQWIRTTELDALN